MTVGVVFNSFIHVYFKLELATVGSETHARRRMKERRRLGPREGDNKDPQSWFNRDTGAELVFYTGHSLHTTSGNGRLAQLHHKPYQRATGPRRAGHSGSLPQCGRA